MPDPPPPRTRQKKTAAKIEADLNADPAPAVIKGRKKEKPFMAKVQSKIWQSQFEESARQIKANWDEYVKSQGGSKKMGKKHARDWRPIPPSGYRKKKGKA